MGYCEGICEVKSKDEKVAKSPGTIRMIQICIYYFFPYFLFTCLWVCLLCIISVKKLFRKWKKQKFFKLNREKFRWRNPKTEDTNLNISTCHTSFFIFVLFWIFRNVAIPLKFKKLKRLLVFEKNQFKCFPLLQLQRNWIHEQVFQSHFFYCIRIKNGGASL